MKPPMKSKVRLSMIILDSNGQPIPDRYGRPQTEQQEAPARVSYEIKTVYDQNGVSHQSVAEIDLPPHVLIDEGSEIEYTNARGEPVTRKVVSLASSLNFSGSRVYYRTAHLG